MTTLTLQADDTFAAETIDLDPARLDAEDGRTEPTSHVINDADGLILAYLTATPDGWRAFARTATGAFADLATFAGLRPAIAAIAVVVGG